MTARAGFCVECGQDVWLRDGGGCINGHQPQSVQSARQVPLPPLLDTFNWGAFFFPVLWPLVKGPVGWAAFFFGLGVISNLIIDLLLVIWWPLAPALLFGNLALGIWFARNANRLLWEHKAWQVNVDAHEKSQRAWGITGLVLYGGFFALVMARVVYLNWWPV